MKTNKVSPAGPRRAPLDATMTLRIEAGTSAPTTGARIGGSWWQRVARERSCGGGRSRSAASERQHARQPSTCRLGRPLGRLERFAGGGAGGQPQRTPVVATHASTRRETGCRGCARYGRVRDGRSCARNGTRARAAIFRQRPETQDAHTGSVHRLECVHMCARGAVLGAFGRAARTHRPDDGAIPILGAHGCAQTERSPRRERPLPRTQHTRRATEGVGEERRIGGRAAFTARAHRGRRARAPLSRRSRCGPLEPGGRRPGVPRREVRHTAVLTNFSPAMG